MLELTIGNKLYSSWSMRPWLVVSEFTIPFSEALIPLAQPDTKERLMNASPNGKVPVLKDGALKIWDSLAIIEYLADSFPDLNIWPKDKAKRAVARAISHEMHSGFAALRTHCPMNLGKVYKPQSWDKPVLQDIERIVSICSEARNTFGQNGEFLFGDFCAADAMFAPVVTRFHTYSVPVDEKTQHYMDTVMELNSFKSWTASALQETWRIEGCENKGEIFKSLTL